MNVIKTAFFVLLSTSGINDGITSTSALHLPSSEISRRSALSTLVTTSTAVVGASGANPSVCHANGSIGGSSVVLNSNNKKAFPLASFGLQIYDDETAYKLTLTALEAGYRNFFASVLAGNQKGFARVSTFSILGIDLMFRDSQMIHPLFCCHQTFYHYLQGS
jgi:hypothetical protein